MHGLPLGWALTGAKADERQVLTDILASSPLLTQFVGHRPTLIRDKNYYEMAFEPT